MICCQIIETALSSSEPLETIRNLLIIGAGLSAYWLGAALRMASVSSRPRRLLANTVLSVPLSFLVTPPLLFAVATSTGLLAFVAALVASFTLGATLNHRVVAHLSRHGLGL